MQTTLPTRTAIAFKGGMFTLTALQLFDTDLKDISEQIDDKIAQAPQFFLFAPIILDFQKLREQDEALDLIALCHLLKAKKLIPIGVRGASQALKDQAQKLDLAQFPEDKSSAATKKPSATPNTTTTTTTATAAAEPTAIMTHTHTRLVTQPIRSGQQIYAQGGDLIVMASVSHGAELLADGHIHVYGAMRGRALAGVQGYTDAMIFCRSLEAELISIAGQYRLSEDLKETCWKQPACIQLLDERLQIRSV